MRSKNLHIGQTWQKIESTKPFWGKAKAFMTIGLDGKQWLACSLICAMLWPVFSLPVNASISYSDSGNANRFEPVNEQLPIWTQTWRNLSVKLESWVTLLKNERFSPDDDANIKKRSDGENGKRSDHPAAGTENEKHNTQALAKKVKRIETKLELSRLLPSASGCNWRHCRSTKKAIRFTVFFPPGARRTRKSFVLRAAIKSSP
jgi:hypothetical protein